MKLQLCKNNGTPSAINYPSLTNICLQIRSQIVGLQKYETTVVQKQLHPLCHQLSLTDSRFCLSPPPEGQTLMQKQILWHFEKLSYHFRTFSFLYLEWHDI